ncbi:hypothetical protein [Altererythrobacter sp.]|uniref:hypothetical protein n=1 Tax=Altererythrobacter sp. TaxID=1872480 RepID=UPI003D0A35A7
MFKRKQNSGKAKRRPIARHPAFPAIVGGWLAVLFGLGVWMLTGEWTFALLAAAMAAYIGFKGAAALGRLSGGQRRSDETEGGDAEAASEEPKRTGRRSAQIISVSELGLDRLPEEESGNPFDYTVEETGEDADDEEEEWPPEQPEWLNPRDALAEAKREAGENAEVFSRDHSGERELPGQTIQPAPDAAEDAPLAENAQFAELPVSEITDRAEQSEAEPGEAEPGAGAVTKLRSQNIEDMSLVQMVERFALALEDHRRRGADTAGASTVSAPDPALMEALRSLPTISRAPAPRYATDGNAALAISTREQVDRTELALREALEKLQRMSGGA